MGHESIITTCLYTTVVKSQIAKSKSPYDRKDFFETHRFSKNESSRFNYALKGTRLKYDHWHKYRLENNIKTSPLIDHSEIKI